MNTKTKTICLLSLFPLALGFWVYSQTVTAQGNVPITVFAVCDVHQAFRDYAKPTDLKNAIVADGKRVKTLIEEANLQLKRMNEELLVSGFLPGSPEYERDLKKLIKKRIETKNFMELSQGDLQRREMQMTDRCYQDVYNAVKKIAQQRNILLVLSREDISSPSQRPEELIRNIYYRRHVIFSAPGIDITREVINRLNTDYKLRR